jgi:hypothetical protein
MSTASADLTEETKPKQKRLKEEAMRSRLLKFQFPIVVSVLLIYAASAWSTPTQTFVPVSIQYSGSTSTAARGINNNGDIVGSYTCVISVSPTKCAGNGYTPNQTHGFVWPAGTSTLLPVDVPSTAGNVTGTLPRGISEQGIVVGQYSVGTVIHGFACASPCSSADSYVFPIDVAGSLFDAAEAQAGSSSPCGPSASPKCPRDTLVVGISPQGDLVGCFHEDNATMTTMHGWMLRQGTFTALATPEGVTATDPDTMNNGIAPTGEIVGFYLTSGVSYMADENGNTETFTFPGNLFTLAYGVNARGDVVGEHGDNQAYSGSMLGMCSKNCFDTNPVGFIRSKQGDYQSLAVQGAKSTFIFGINSFRCIVGQYVDSNGAHGFVYRLDEANS